MESVKEPESKYFKVQNLHDLGPHLPIIRKVNSVFIDKREFSFRSWTFETEEKIGDLKKNAKGPGDFAVSLLAEMLDQYCGENFADMDVKKKEAILSAESFGNIMYMYFYLRYDEVDNMLKMNLTCPHNDCGELINDFTVDLNDLEVHVKDETHEREILYELKNPILFAGRTVTHVKLGVTAWAMMISASQEVAENTGKMKRIMLQNSITGLQTDTEFPLPMSEVLKDMKKYDIEKCISLVVQNNAGPKMGMSGECPHCKKKFFKDLNWSYDYFFDSSSL